MLISEKIFILMNQNGMSQKEFSEQTEISQSTISDWKRKKTNPSADKILKICEVLNISPYELLSEKDNVNKENEWDISVLNKDEEIIVEHYRCLSGKNKERLLGYLSALLGR